MTKHRRLTQRQLARTIGVSDMTVSRVLSGRGTVSARTRERVLAAVHEHNYLPNRLAGSLASSRSNQVGVVLPSLMVGFFPEVAAGVAFELEKAGYNPVIGVTDYDVAREEGLVESMLSWNAAGMIVNDFVHTDRTERLLRDAAVPVVEIMAVSGEPIDLCVGFDHAEAARHLTDHLIAKGYRQFAFLGWHGTAFAASVRFQAIRDHLAARALPLIAPQWFAAPPGVAEGKSALKRLMEEAPHVDAVIFGNDLMAVGGLLCCEQNGWDVPGRLALAGFGGMSIGQEMKRPLTTIDFPRYEVGRRAARTVLNALAGQDLPSICDLRFTLVEGRTS